MRHQGGGAGDFSRAALVAVLVYPMGACTAIATRGRERTLTAGGVTVSQDAKARAARLDGGGVTAWVSSPGGELDGVLSLHGSGRPRSGPIAWELRVGDRRLRPISTRSEIASGTASLVSWLSNDRHGLGRVGGDGPDGVSRVGEVETTLSPDGTVGVVQRFRLRDPSGGDPVQLRWTTSRAGREVVVASLPATPPDAELPATQTPYVIVGGGTPLVLAGRAPLSVSATRDGVVVSVTHPHAPIDVAVTLAIAASMRDALELGRRLSGTDAPRGGRIALETRDRRGAHVPARVLVEGEPRTGPPFVLDPTRSAEPTAPLIDVTSPDTVVELPAGRYSLRATHGIGWSIASSTVEVDDGDVIRAPMVLDEEAPHAGWIGCDLHVHARGSFDATAVSYEDRVRSLAAVGVDCAAATEHDRVGDHGPAARALGLDPMFLALPGVELTTLAPAFGHFNVYPWPHGAQIPATKSTSPGALFDAVHALPGGRANDFVFQLNHPRMRMGDGTSIGYFDLAGLDPRSGDPRGKFSYRRDYDAIELFNGYQLDDLPAVRSLIDEWLRMLDRGEVHVATGSSDSHSMSFPWAGFPRTLVWVGSNWREQGRPISAVVDGIRHGHVSVTSGPIVDVRVGSAGIGDDVRVQDGSGGGARSFARIEVRLTSWLERPSSRVRVGTDDLGDVELRASPSTPGLMMADVPLPRVRRRRALVVTVEAALGPLARGIAGMSRSLAVTNPVWLLP